MLTPTVHLNGSSREHLLENFVEAADNLRIALQFMEAAAPNPRDYYPQGPNVFEIARREHTARVEHVKAVLGQYEALVNSVDQDAF